MELLDLLSAIGAVIVVLFALAGFICSMAFLGAILMIYDGGMIQMGYEEDEEDS